MWSGKEDCLTSEEVVNWSKGSEPDNVRPKVGTENLRIGRI